MSDTGTRGRTVIHDRVERRLIEHAALSVPGVRRHGGFAGLAGRSLPAVRAGDLEDDGGVDVDVAATWPVDTDRLIGAVSDSVSEELRRSLGRAPEKVTVHVVRADAERSAAQVTALAGREAPDGGPRGRVRKLAPRRTDGAVLLSVPVLLALLGLGAVALHDALVAQGWLSGARWLDGPVRAADDLGWAWWTWPLAIASIVLGLVLVVLAIKPRKRSHVHVTDDLWLRPDFAAGARTGTRKEMR
ncbi:Asp23/Gls24 family envelope stress response protein [Tsukamurella sp. 1534]|uniref:Asp23/Gls24 family envelope stress response protein n=1 Tax=Tsukamurella sp. 1534 TaxID=1151061 RepID=UPI0011D275A5|nr:Asp23/Gls24 family envelope stress response protein [Tsukamurella sp. 1534]